MDVRCSKHYFLMQTQQTCLRDWTNAILMLAHRLRRWSNIKIALVQSFMFAGEVARAYKANVLLHTNHILI